MAGERIKRIGTCKNCFCALGYNSLRQLVHQRTNRESCNGNSGSKKAELR